MSVRASSAALGLAAAAGTYAYISREIWGGFARLADAMPTPPPKAPPEAEAPTLFGTDVRARMAGGWNVAVDAAFRKAIGALPDGW